MIHLNNRPGAKCFRLLICISKPTETAKICFGPQKQKTIERQTFMDHYIFTLDWKETIFNI